MSTDIGAKYIKASSVEALITGISQLPSEIKFRVKFALSWLFATLALLLMIAGYIPEIISQINKRLNMQKKQ